MFRSEDEYCLKFLKDDWFSKFEDEDDLPTSPPYDTCSKKQVMQKDNGSPKTTPVSNGLISFLHKFDFQSKIEACDEASLQTIIKDDKLKSKSNVEHLVRTERTSLKNDIIGNKQNIASEDANSLLNSTKRSDKEIVTNKSPIASISKNKSHDTSYSATDDDDAFFDDDLSFDVFIDNEFDDNLSPNKIEECTDNRANNSVLTLAGSSILSQNHKKLPFVAGSSQSDEISKTNFIQDFCNLDRFREEHQPTFDKHVQNEKKCLATSVFEQSLVTNENTEISSYKNSCSSPILSSKICSNKPARTYIKNINNCSNFQENKTDDNYLSLVPSSPFQTFDNFLMNKGLTSEKIQKWKDVTPPRLQRCEKSVISDEIQQYTTPLQTKKFPVGFGGSSSSRKRKFPGPAGLLPDLPPNSPLTSKEYEHCLQMSNSEQEYDQELLCSQESSGDFLSLPWCKMVKDLGSQSSSLLCNFNIKYIKMKAAKKKLPKFIEVPFFCALTKSICFNGTEFKVTLKDETGEVSAKIEQDIYERFSELLHVGSVLVLKNVTFLLNQLIVKLNNIIRIYSSDGEIVNISSWDYVNKISYGRNSVSPDDKPCCSKSNANKSKSSTSDEQCNYVVDLADESVFEDDFNDIMCSIDESSFTT